MKIYIYYVYILSNLSNSVSYTGVTNDLERRCYERKKKLYKGFSQKYNVNKLVYCENFDFINAALAREKQIKGYSREKKVNLFNGYYREWKELYCNGRIIVPDP